MYEDISNQSVINTIFQGFSAYIGLYKAKLHVHILTVIALPICARLKVSEVITIAIKKFGMCVDNETCLLPYYYFADCYGDNIQLGGRVGYHSDDMRPTAAIVHNTLGHSIAQDGL